MLRVHRPGILAQVEANIKMMQLGYEERVKCVRDDMAKTEEKEKLILEDIANKLGDIDEEIIKLERLYLYASSYADLRRVEAFYADFLEMSEQQQWREVKTADSLKKSSFRIEETPGDLAATEIACSCRAGLYMLRQVQRIIEQNHIKTVNTLKAGEELLQTMHQSFGHEMLDWLDNCDELAIALSTEGRWYEASCSNTMASSDWQVGMSKIAPRLFYVWVPLELPDECHAYLHQCVAPLVSEDGKMLETVECTYNHYIDVKTEYDMEYAMAAMQGYALRLLEQLPPIPLRVFFLDTVRFDPHSLGILRPLDVPGGQCIAPAPMCDEDVEKSLSRLLDMQRETDSPPDRYLFIRLNSADPLSNGPLRQIMLNAETYHLHVFVIIPMQEGTKPRYLNLLHLILDAHIVMANYDGEGTTMNNMFLGDFFPPPSPPSPEAVKTLLDACKPQEVGNLYHDWIDGCKELPDYKRPSRNKLKLTLPFGVADGKLQSITLDNMDFAAYLLGASGSGKSTMLDTLISAVVDLYHPDDVELWLADMGNSAFHRFAEHMLPHIRYLVLDDSIDAIAAFLFKLDDEFERRKKLFAKAGGIENFKDYPPELPMSRIFVIIDEFNPLLKALEDMDNPYSMRCSEILNKLLQQTRKYGFCFLFANQTYARNTMGLTPSMRTNIGMRIAMKAPVAEMNALLEVPDLSPMEENRIAHIPPYHALFYGKQAQPLSPCCKVLFQPGKEIAKRNEQAHKLWQNLTWEDKHPIVVDSTKRITWEEREQDVENDIRGFIEENTVYRKGDLLLYPGSPRNLERVRRCRLEKEQDENLLLLCPDTQKRELLLALTSEIRAIYRSARMQRFEVEIWADEYALPLRQAGMIPREIPSYTDLGEVSARIREAYDSMEYDRDKLIFILSANKLISRLEDYEKEQKRKKTRTASAAAPKPAESGDPFLAGLMALNNFSSAPVSAAEDGEPASRLLRELFQFGPAHGTHFVVHFSSDYDMERLSVEQERFHHSLLHKAGAVDLRFRRYAANLTNDWQFAYLFNRDTAIYMPYAMPDFPLD